MMAAIQQGLPRAIISVQETKHVHTAGLIYGFPGSGKSVLAGTGPNTLILSTERGRLTPADFGSDAKVWPITAWENFSEAVKYLSSPNPFKNVCIDNGSELQDILMDDLVLASYTANPAKRHEVIPAQDNYLEAQLLLKKSVRRLNALPGFNTWWFAHVLDTEDEEGDDLALPMFKSKNAILAQQITGMMPIVAYLEETTPDSKSEYKNKLHFRKHGKYLARVRFQTLGAAMDQPTIPKILARLGKSEGATTTRTTPRPAKRVPRPSKKV
jgi:hypothetical protein